MALGERFTRSAVACEFSFLPVLRTARSDAFCDLRPVLGIAGRLSVRRDRRAFFNRFLIGASTSAQ
jgi:hypothetical protein